MEDVGGQNLDARGVSSLISVLPTAVFMPLRLAYRKIVAVTSQLKHAISVKS